jgi:hypothetical protein
MGLCETSSDCKEGRGWRRSKLNQEGQTKYTKIPHQCYEMKLERSPPGHGEEGCNYKIEDVTQRRQISESQLSQEEIRKKLDQSTNT